MISFNVQIRDFPFNENSQGLIENWKNGKREYGSNWPVVYLIHNDDTKEAYVGETLNAGKRAAQHWQVSERQRLKTIHIMTDDTFNKSVILDLESFLIKYISADGKYKLQNGNAGLSDFDYYSRNEYEQQFQKIWDKVIDEIEKRGGRVHDSMVKTADYLVINMRTPGSSKLKKAIEWEKKGFPKIIISNDRLYKAFREIPPQAL